MTILQKIYAFFIDTIQSILLAAAVFLVIYVFLFRPFVVQGESMYPNFQDQEHVITDLVSYRFGDPKLGDVVVFKAPPDPEKDYIKRIIGVPGDSVSVKDGQVYVNNKLLNESAYLKDSVKTYGGAFLQDGASATVPDGDYFVLGDNRNASSDSRAWGFVKRSELIGKSFFIYWPLNKAGVVKNPFN